MPRSGALVLALLLAPSSLFAQEPAGFKLAKVPDAVYAQFPQLPSHHGILIEVLDPQSPAHRGGLRRFDIVLSIHTKALDARLPAEFAALAKLLAAPPKEPALLSVLRGGKNLALEFPSSEKSADLPPPKGFMKPGGPPAVSVEAQPLEKGRLNLVVRFYADNSSKLEQRSYEGALDDIEQQLHAHAREHRLPENVVDLVDVALKRIRKLNEGQK